MSAGTEPTPSPGAPTPALPPWLRVAAALTHRDFRVLWAGACVSTIGTWMQKVAQNWLVLTLTGSAFYLGLDAFLGEVPILLFMLVGGVIADRHDRRRLLIGSQYVQMAAAFALMTLVLADVVRVWHILALSFLTGTAQAFGGPAYQSLIPQLVTKDHLPNAIALNSIQFNIARIIGPLIAGAALAAFGSAACFGLNGLSFFVVIVALMSLHVAHVARTSDAPLLDEMRSGLRYVRHDRAIVSLMILACLTTFLGHPLLTFLPIFAQSVLGGGAGEYSRMMAASGAGAITGAVVVAWLGRSSRMGRTLLTVHAFFGFVIVAFALSRTLWLSYMLLFVGGAMSVLVLSMTTSLVQLIAPNEMRGRVISIYMMAFRGGMPLGSLASGFMAETTSAPTALIVNGLLLGCVSAYFLTKNRSVRAL